MKKKLIAIFLWMAVLFLPGLLQAYGLLPLMISYQGRLVDRNNVPVSGNLTLRFNIYDAVTGGNLIWGFEDQPVTIVRGVFNVQLGSVTSLSGVAFDKPYWLDVSIGGVSMAPRRPLLSSPYSLIAGSVVTNSIRAVNLKSDTNSLRKVSGGVMTAASNRIYIGISTNSPPSIPLFVNGNIRINDTNKLQFGADVVGVKIDLGVGTTKSKWIGIDDSGNWYMSFSDDAGFRWYNSSGRAWGTAIMDLDTEGIKFPDAQKHRINLGQNAGKAKWIGIDGNWDQAYATDGGFSWYKSNGTTSWGTNTMKLDNSGNLRNIGNISNGGYRTGSYGDYMIFPLYVGNGYQSYNNTGWQDRGGTIIVPEVFRPDRKLEVNLFVLAHLDHAGTTEHFTLYDNTNSLDILFLANLNNSSDRKWCSTGWLSWQPAYGGEGGGIDVVFKSYTEDGGNAIWIESAYLAVRPALGP